MYTGYGCFAFADKIFDYFGDRFHPMGICDLLSGWVEHQGCHLMFVDSAEQIADKDVLVGHGQWFGCVIPRPFV